MEPEPYVWAIYVSSFAAVGRNKGYNQLYLIQLGEARKLGNRNERRRAGKRWATLPPTVSDTVGFGYLSNVFFCGLLAPSPGNLPGAAATGASLFTCEKWLVYSRRSAAGSARTKVTRCHKRKWVCLIRHVLVFAKSL